MWECLKRTHVDVLALDDGLADVLPADDEPRDGARDAVPLEHARDELRDRDGAQRRARRGLPQRRVSCGE